MEMSTTMSNPDSVSDFPSSNPTPNNNKRKRSLPGNPDPAAEVIALSPKTLMTTNRFVCEICNKGFQRDQNLQLHRRGHNLPWKLKQRPSKEMIRKKVYICPEVTCVHHDPSRALGDLTGIKKHFFRKHGEKKWKCEKCSKKYAVQSDWKAHSKVCGTREYKCDCGTIFSRRDSFITHRAFCDALTEEATCTKATPLPVPMPTPVPSTLDPQSLLFSQDFASSLMENQFSHLHARTNAPNEVTLQDQCMKQEFIAPWESMSMPLPAYPTSAGASQNTGLVGNSSAHLSATALLQKAAQMGATMSNGYNTQMASHGSSNANMSGFGLGLVSTSQQDQLHEMVNRFDGSEGLRGDDVLTRDFLGLRALSQRGILSMPGLDQCMNASTSSFDQNKESWHG
ncbi:zinc finger protein NUTCRACKER-like protein [Carex littledalei]|uniref:Protein EARLY HEADING DATE 2 n=1 Tax=Carex littledalei TaxID=544730 RepID=A0A833QH89_9POAL|nr:zinc finger protein NUTCRACKER-like protein [Carex littledalei]